MHHLITKTLRQFMGSPDLSSLIPRCDCKYDSCLLCQFSRQMKVIVFSLPTSKVRITIETFGGAGKKKPCFGEC